MSMDVKAHCGANLRQAIKNVERDENLITEASHIDDDLSRQLVRERSGNLRNHDRFWIFLQDVTGPFPLLPGEA